MEFCSDLIKENKGNHKVLFSPIDRMLNLTPEKCYPSCESAKELCNNFADFFSSKIASIRSNLDSLALPDTSFRFFRFDNPSIQCEFNQFKPTTAVELSKLITKIARESCSLDPIPSNLLKLCFSDLVPIITKIVNCSLESGEVPLPIAIKRAIYFFFLKNRLLTLHELYPSFRPVSNLMFVSKATEKAAATQLWEYFCSNGLNEELQPAYKANHSCETALIRVQDDVPKAIDSHRGVLLLLLDLSAVFDIVDLDILPGRLSTRFGVKGKALDWLRSYLTNRTQLVKVDDASSMVRPLHWGVPQG